ncbi:hypothetical protein AtubIFM56815_000124 [Aspergillus tubingensis]|uniref:Uncharacterized protein n=1 Tax=Aspergillus tubingensis TaxID=5068 RepID=A0A8H3Y1A5_ASPTU|nr:transcription factor IIIC subunit delta N-term-domain-containing protein [Aspergillus tubingensis]GFN18397.1 transcription factor IIIC subunit delta N-term-domain-containing protein [Aspergillus tubingensis]GLA60084.1 hypothetical protein AtubIFM54640_011515 [Aspergillus tubingensis]GLA79335.1 hypothetical protein AtubIFM56815_000124 [Aspergillus tubingensis]
MSGPLELPLFPSCYDCLSWSEDGELAIAAGDHVQILTPKNAAERLGHDTSQSPINNWHSVRFRVNVFTNNEWPTIYPQNRDNFSLGAEQSLSNVVALAWSPPGLAKYRRCVLAVLTSNLLLSLYEPVGSQGKWTRVGILNGALKTHFNSTVQEDGMLLRKSSIRAFAWSPPLKLTAERHITPYSVLPAESRWGFHLLSVANDDNDVVVLRIHRPPTGLGPPYEAGVLSVNSFQDTDEHYPKLQPSSIFSEILRSKIKILSMSWGPWFHAKESASGFLAVTHGTALKVVHLDVKVLSPTPNTGSQPQSQIKAISKDITPKFYEGLNKYHFTGPLEWMNTDDSHTVCLAAGTLAGLILIKASKEPHKGINPSSGQVRLQELLFYESPENDSETEPPRHSEPISAMIVAMDTDSQAPVLYLATAGGFTAAVPFRDGDDEYPIFAVPWKDQLDDVRERYDFDRDLGGLAVARAWGMASCKGMIAAGITVHPGDMIEYRTAAEERLTIIMSTTDGSQSDGLESRSVSDNSPEYLRQQREAALGYILHFEDNNENRQPLSLSILYATACCTIIDSKNEALLSQAHKVLVRLATITGVDLNDELSKCTASRTTIAPKPVKMLDGPGGQMFERCEICSAGIAWYSTEEAQCAAGHVFVRCSLTSLAIQDPGSSKVCSSCGKEYLDEDSIEPSESDVSHTCRTLFDAFDTCVYCNGKYRA